MANPDGELTVAQRLGRALDRGLLPAGGPAEAAERLIERLERPARIALLGLPGAGKSSVLNLLVGSVVVPETLRLPTIIVQHGDVARMVCTLTDGTTKVVPGGDLAEVLPLAPALVTLELDLPALRVISLLEVSAGPMEAEQKRAATWASKRTDIVIWCTTSYLPKEQAVWESLPDAVKDNSFMFLTKVDLLGNRESAQAMHDRVELRAGEEFRQILSISAKQARAAMPPGGQVNRELFRDSGASAVITAIKTRVQSGRRADMDTAELLLARHVEASELVSKRFAEEEEASPAAWAPPPEPAAAPIPEPAPLEVVEAARPVAADSVVPAAMEPEAVTQAEPAPEPEPEAQPEAPADSVSVAEPEAPPAAEPDVDVVVAAGQAAQTTAEAEAAVSQPEPETGSRRRFADRIKRVASDADPAASPLMPLRTTWKSKAEAEAPATAEPEAPKAEPSRRPRASIAPPIEAETPAVEPAFEPEPVVEAVQEPVEPTPEPEAVAPVPDERPPLGERPPRAVTPRPAPEPETPRIARPQLFGARKPVGSGRETPLPDLSSLRATPEEMEAALADEGREPVDEEEGDVAELPLSNQDSPPPPSEPLPQIERPIARPPRSADREMRVRPAPIVPGSSGESEHAPEERPERPSIAAPRPLPSAPAATPDPFSPAAIMRRDVPEGPAAPAPRRERPRIAARAVPVSSAPAPVVPAAPVEHSLVEEAIGLIVTRSAELVSEIDPEAKVPVDLILDHARETGELLQAVTARGRSEELRRINSDVGEVMDLIMLMQLEKGHAPADDALTLLLQLKRELETLSAA
jgi:hypothetical protein